jgi:hypothetical protein
MTWVERALIKTTGRQIYIPHDTRAAMRQRLFLQEVSLLKRHVNYIVPEYPHPKENHTTKVGWDELTIQRPNRKGYPSYLVDKPWSVKI